MAALVSAWLSWWVPTRGKAWVEARLEQQIHAEVAIGAMRYSPWEGFVLDEVTVDERATGTRWLDAPRLRVRVALLDLLLRRPVAFRVAGMLHAPCETEVVLTGRYAAGPRVSVAVTTSDMALSSVIPTLAQRLPPGLTSGDIRADLHVTWHPETDLLIVGELSGTQLVWEQASLRLTADVHLNGTIAVSPADSALSVLDVTLQLEEGRLDGVPIVGTATRIQGTIHADRQEIAIERLSGSALDSPWQLDGEILLQEEPLVDARLRSRVELASLAARLPEDVRRWQPTGAADLTLVCRGPLRHTSMLDIMAQAVLEDTAASIPPRGDRLEQVRGTLRYDHLTRELTVEVLEGRVQQAPMTLRGLVQLADPPTLNLTVHATADAALLRRLAAERLAEMPVDEAAGSVSLDVALSGPTTQLQWDGRAELRDARVVIRGLPAPLEAITGAIEFRNDSLATDELRLVVAGEPLRVQAAITALTTAPHLTGRLQMADTSLATTATLHADRVELEQTELLAGNSRASITGKIGRAAPYDSRLTASGTIELTDLSKLPWVNTKTTETLTSWALDGRAEWQLRLLGPLSDWRAAQVAGTARADRFSGRGLEVRQASLELEQVQRRLTVRLTNAVVADGKTTGQFVLTHDAPARYLLEADLTMIDLAALIPVIPAWRNRSIQGRASAHTTLMGHWGDRGSARGEGWFNAAGDHLGELPILDRLFGGIFGALADRLGLASLRKAELTKAIAQWRLAQERVTTEDLRLIGMAAEEPIVVSIRGSVGLDKTLDLVVEPDLPERLMMQAPELSSAIMKLVGNVERIRRLAGRHRLAGTIDKPVYKFELSWEQLLNSLFPSRLDQLLHSLP